MAAILFPVFARARESARRASCLSNLKQIGLGVMMYTQDYDEKYPKAWASNSGPQPAMSTGTNTWYWYHQIYSYVKSEQLFICPSSSSANPLSLNYGVNEFTLRRNENDPLTIATVDSAATTYMIFDAGYYRIQPAYIYNSSSSSYSGAQYFFPGEGVGGADCTTNWGTKSYFSDCENGRHFDGGNMIFADGHVKWLKGAEVVKQAKNYQAGNASAWNPAKSS